MKGCRFNMKRKSAVVNMIIFAAVFSLLSPVAVAAETPQVLTVSPNRIVSMEYTLFVDDNKILETTKGKKPMTFVQGRGQILKGLEEKIDGMRIGEKKTVILKPEEGYGKIRDDFFSQVPIEKLPGENVAEGDVLMVTGKDGKPVQCRVTAISEDKALLDFNHPLAGKTLRYRLKIIDVKDLRQMK